MMRGGRDQRFDSRIVWRAPIMGGQPQKLLSGEFTTSPVVSPDNRMLAVAYRVANTKEDRLSVMPLDNLSQRLYDFKFADGAVLTGQIKWTPDGKSLIYTVSNKGVGNLWLQPLDENAAAKQFTHLTNNRIYAFDWLPNGREIVCARGEQLSHVVLLRLTRKA